MRATTRLAAVTLAGMLALAGAVGLAACSAKQNSAPSTSAERAPAPGAAGAGDADYKAEAPTAVPAPAVQDNGQQAPTKIEPDVRSLIYTGSIGVRVENVVEAADKATDIATGVGGVIGGDRRTLDGAKSEAQLTLRVPADKFTPVLDQLAKLGVEESRSVQADDVTEQLVDLDARVASQQASVDRVRALLAKANTIGEVVSVESELTRRVADLDSLKQRRAKIGGLVALSTITVNLHGTAAPEPGPKEPETGFLAGLRSGWAGFLSSVKVVLTVAGYMLPWIIAIGVPIWALVWVMRRRRRPVPLPAQPTPPPPADA
jgi:Domain of unknown function (DUF4349)